MEREEQIQEANKSIFRLLEEGEDAKEKVVMRYGKEQEKEGRGGRKGALIA